MEPNRKLKVMCIYAHPADPITDCGGAIALHSSRGDECYALVLTHGGRKHPNYIVREWRKPNPDPKIINMTKQDIIDFKKNELKRAAKIVGYKQLFFLDHDDDNLMMTDEIIDEVAAVIAKVQPDILIMDYPFQMDDVHSLTTKIAFKALERIGHMLQNLDQDKVGEPSSFQYSAKAIFFTKVAPTMGTALVPGGHRNDVFINITPVVEKKMRGMDQFISQGYEGNFARKFIEAHDGAYGRGAGVAYAEPYVRYRREVHDYLPVTSYALGHDGIMEHENYSVMDARSTYPYDVDWFAKNYPDFSLDEF